MRDPHAPIPHIPSHPIPLIRSPALPSHPIPSHLIPAHPYAQQQQPAHNVLHTGDCRLAASVLQDPTLKKLAGRDRALEHLTLVLDTTYCDPAYDFPPQEEVLRFAATAARAEAHNPKTLFLFGT